MNCQDLEMAFDGRILSGVSVLAAVVEGSSFVKAAELIGITDSGVSRAIGRLETRLNVRLLDRATRWLTMTDEGRRFYEEVKPHLNAIEDAATVASGATSAVRGRLKVDIDPFFLPLVLAGRLGAFCERYPELAVEFVTSEHVGDFVAEGVDLAIRTRSVLFVYRPPWQTQPSFGSRPASLLTVSRSPYGKTLRVAVRPRQRDGRSADQRPANLHRSQVDAARVRRGDRHLLDNRLRRRRPSSEGESHQLVSRLARRAFSALRLPPIAQASAPQGPRVRRFLRRDYSYAG
jgi:DNA-binding transcriptional LysR family regulator